MTISVFKMIMDAGLMGKLVMLCLLLFSIISWSIIVMKQLMFKRAAKNTDAFLERFWASKTLNEAYKHAQEHAVSPEAAVFAAGYSELNKINASQQGQAASRQTLENRLASMDNLKRALRKAQSLELERLGRSLPFLATTGSATPFIGLFGTVWGIMTSFQDIGQRGSASLAVVAPGISEALVATAAGLAVAIPAVIFFNFFSNKHAKVEAAMDNFATDFLNLVERDMIARS